MKNFKLGKFTIGKSDTIFLPDISTFFDKDIEEAFNLINQVSKSGLKIIKGEILHDEDIVLNTNLKVRYYDRIKKKIFYENYKNLIERKVNSLKNYNIIFNYAKKLGLDLVFSVYDTKGVDFSLKIGAIAIKIPSSNINHKHLIEYSAKKNIPIIIDTGHSTIEEISRAINWLQDAGQQKKIIIEHSPLAPPTNVKFHNLLFMKTLQKTFNYNVGLSDHHDGNEMLYAATALGAVIVEKGVCVDRNKINQDVAHSIQIDELKEVNKKIQNISRGLGNGIRYLNRSREKYSSRMGIIAKKNIKNGERITLKNIKFAWPIKYIGSEDIDQILNKKLKKNIKRNEPIKKSDVSFE